MLVGPVQPRACGEHHDEPAAKLHAIGSAPRLRGTRLKVQSGHLVVRFSPAPAGNTPSFSAMERASTVQPRACGEHRHKTICIDMDKAVQPRACGEHLQTLFPGRGNAGSAPRLRGTRNGLAHHMKPRRFSPAPAGNTSVPHQATHHTAVQPRACGEHHDRDLTFSGTTGSAPRLRGTLPTLKGGEQAKRFSPAPAGNTADRARAWS